ncbi:acyltransferase family protein [Microbacterium sp. T2.11-28]|uniref:acyltransferase family protein n=1 Tax=Microbacterium sp. T2.11-28 TaxID=3041169 RepID=UPI00247758EE|nr:acyltransferase family protein [Microbacterium sp. T2.11-28]CAI9393843.1 hypothetical protein MICABA_02586 [Microbacterium sp. T2.11-28]
MTDAALATPGTTVPGGLRRRSARRGPQRFRADIQALRAIAVLLVVVYHLRPNRLPGGYIGVDVFFVISGFLITSHLVRDAARTGRVRLGAFWAARARRILPASLVAIGATVAVTSWFAPVTAFADLAKQALASIFYVENWVLAGDAVDYSAAENDATPFQHFWSLSVEEQFYLFWPLIVFAALWIVARRKGAADGHDGRRLRLVLLVMFGAVVLASFAYSVYAVSQGQVDAYFVTTTRVWELGAGGLLAVIGVRRLPRGVRALLVYAGLAAIAVSAFTLTSESPFPGLAALPVILGTVAVIVGGTAGQDAPAPVPPSWDRWDPWTRASRLRAVQWIGDRSYSLYLWHFPVIIIWTMMADRTVDHLDIIAMSVVSVVLAHFSYEFIEQPVRRASYFSSSTPRTLIAGLVAMVLVAGTTFAYPVMTARAAGGGDWDALAQQASALPRTGAAAVLRAGDVPTFTTADAAVTPSPLLAGSDRNAIFSDAECVAGQRDAVTPECTAGDPSADPSVVLVGDSHARMYSTALAELAERDDWHLRTYLHNACPFNPVPREIEVQKESVCTAPNEVVMDELLASRPDLVVTTWSSSAAMVDDGAEGAPGAAGFAEYWNRLEDAGIQVLVIRDTPRMSVDVPDCVAQNYDDPDECAVPREKGLRGEAVFADATRMAPRASVADFTDRLCTAEVCKAVVGNVVAFTDRHHLSDTFVRTLKPELAAALTSALAAG